MLEHNTAQYNTGKREKQNKKRFQMQKQKQIKNTHTGNRVA